MERTSCEDEAVDAPLGSRGPDAGTEGSTSTKDQRADLDAELRRICLELQLSQAQMATRLEIGTYAPGGRKVSTPRAAVSHYERGNRVTAEVLNAYRLACPAAGGRLDKLQAGRDGADPEPSASAADRGAAAGAPAQQQANDPPPTRRSRRTVAGLAVAAAAAAGATAIMIVVALHEDPPRPSNRVWVETTGTPAHTWANPSNPGVHAGPPLGPREAVSVSCRVRGYVVSDGDPWWYRLAGKDWHNDFYATSDAFYNNGQINGPVDNGIIVDDQVALCR